MEMKEMFFLERDTEISEHLYSHPPKGTWNLYADNMERNTEISMYLLSQCASEPAEVHKYKVT